MGLYSEKILPWMLHLGMKGNEFPTYREKVVSQATGEVLEIGFGSGLNLPFYKSDVEALTAVEPSAKAWDIAKKKLETSPFPVKRICDTAESLDLASQSVDSAVVTWSLCTIPDPVAALKECRRLLKPEGRLYFVEHGLSSDAKVQRWQHRWNPIQKQIAGGCHVNRDIAELIRQAGFQIDHLENFYLKGPKFLTYHYLGTATP